MGTLPSRFYANGAVLYLRICSIGFRVWVSTIPNDGGSRMMHPNLGPHRLEA